MMSSDEQLILDYQRGTQGAFVELFERYREAIYGFFRRRLADIARAEELAQETFLAVLRGATRYEPRALFRTYLYGIAMKQLAAARRKQAHEPANPVAALPAPGHDPDTTLWIRQAVGRLDADEREILLLREFEQLSYSEIAELLRIPINTVRSRLFRARAALKSLLLSQPSSSKGTEE